MKKREKPYFLKNSAFLKSYSVFGNRFELFMKFRIVSRLRIINRIDLKQKQYFLKNIMFLQRDRVFDSGFEFFVKFRIFLCIQIINWMDGRHKNKRQHLKIRENSRKKTPIIINIICRVGSSS